MTQKHTKGPWVVRQAEKWPWDISIEPNILHITRIAYGTSDKTLDDVRNGNAFGYDKRESIARMVAEQEANARLIASAPELLEALEKTLEMLEELKIESGRGIDWGEEDAFRMGEWFERDEIAAMKIAGAAIAKAKGDAQ